MVIFTGLTKNALASFKKPKGYEKYLKCAMAIRSFQKLLRSHNLEITWTNRLILRGVKSLPKVLAVIYEK